MPYLIYEIRPYLHERCNGVLNLSSQFESAFRPASMSKLSISNGGSFLRNLLVMINPLKYLGSVTAYPNKISYMHTILNKVLQDILIPIQYGLFEAFINENPQKHDVLKIFIEELFQIGEIIFIDVFPKYFAETHNGAEILLICSFSAIEEINGLLPGHWESE